MTAGNGRRGGTAASQGRCPRGGGRSRWNWTILAMAGGLAAAQPLHAAEGEAKGVVTPAPAPLTLSMAGERVAGWIGRSGDNHALPYAVIDKAAATLTLFNAKGALVETVPVLIGIATGDEATPGVGTKNLAEIGPAEKTTPAGRFLARFGTGGTRERILWVDFATSVAIHPIPATSPKSEKRRERMLSVEADDNRITFGCINVPKAFYARRLRPAFARKGGYVYILPDTKPIEDVFPRLGVEAVAGR